MRDKLKTVLLIVFGILLLVCGGLAGFFFWQKEKVIERESAARVEAQNRIAQLSQTVRENEITWSRLAQEKETTISELSQHNEQLASMIHERDERIQDLTTAVATLRTVRVVVREPNQSEPEPGRLRVDFDETYENFWRVHGFTLTNPAEADISVDFTRPANFTVVTTQLQDLSWRTYITTDVPNLEIGQIDSRINPISRPAEQIPWYHGIYLGVGGSVAVTGNSGTGYFEAGYDFGDIELGIQAGGIAYPGGVDFGLGLSIRLNPFAL